MWGRVLSSRILLVTLSALYPAVFLASENWHVYTTRELGFLVLTTLAIAATIGIAFCVFSEVVARVADEFLSTDKGRRLLDIVVRKALPAALAATLLLVLMLAVIGSISESPLVLAAVFAVFVIFFVIAAIRFGLRVLNFGLLLMLILAAGSWGLSYGFNPRLEAVDSWHAKNRASNDSITLVDRPNVYVLVLESYNSPEATGLIYDFGNDSFIDKLESLQFEVSRRHFSNYRATLMSLASLLAMEHHYTAITAGQLDAHGAREVIGGVAYSSVLSVFKNNGYFNQYIFKKNYSVFDSGDTLDYAYPEDSILDVFDIYQNDGLRDALVRSFGRAVFSGDSARRRVSSEEFLDAVNSRIDVAAGSADPHFTLVKPPWTRHTKGTDTWAELAHWEDAYRRILRKGNSGFLEIIEAIIQDDPNAVVILIGDHGPHRYRGVWKGGGVLQDLLEERGVTGEELALDLFGTFLAVRYPGGNPEDVMADTHANVFRNLFAVLSHNEEILETRVEDNSYFSRDGELYIAVESGRPLPVWAQAEISENGPVPLDGE